MDFLTEGQLVNGVYDIFKNAFTSIKRKIKIRKLIFEASEETMLNLNNSTELYSRLEAVFSDDGLKNVISKVSKENGYTFIDVLTIEMTQILKELRFSNDNEVNKFVGKFINLLQYKIKTELPELYSQILLIEIKVEHGNSWRTILLRANDLLKITTGLKHLTDKIDNNQEAIMRMQEESLAEIRKINYKTSLEYIQENGNHIELPHWPLSLNHLKSPYNDKHFNLNKNIESYLYLFSQMTHIKNVQFEGNILDKMYEIINSSTSMFALSVRGEYGVGKTTLLSLFYWFQHNKWCKDDNEYFPIFINLNNYDYYIYDDLPEENIQSQAVELVRKEMIDMAEYIKKMKIKKVLLLVDGDDGYELKKACFNAIYHYINKEIACEGDNNRVRKIAGHSISKYKNNEQVFDYQNIIDVRGIKVDADNVEQYICEFTKISYSGIDKSLVENVLVDINDLYDITLDFFTLYIIFYTYKNNGGIIIFEETIKKFCIMFLNNKSVSNKSERCILHEASKLAFQHFIEKIRIDRNTLLESKDYWELIHFHPTVASFLIAHYIFCTLDSNTNTNRNDKVLDYIYPNLVNRFCKKMIDKNIKVQDNIISIANKIIEQRESELTYSGANIAYYLGRIKHKRSDARIILKRLIKKINNVIEKVDSTEQRKMLFVLRSAYVSLIHMNDTTELTKYIKKMIECKVSLKMNINFFIMYYEEVNVDKEKFVDDLGRDINECENTFNKLLSKIDNEAEDFKQDNAVFQFNLFTLFSIFTVSINISWKRTKKEDVKSILNKVINQKNKLIPILQEVLEWMINYIDDKTYTGIGLIKEISELKAIYREGWLKRKLKSKIETVASHSFMCTLYGLMLLKESPEYSKEKVLKMLLIHDLAETFTGDKVTPDKRKEDIDNEKKWMRHISLYNLLNNYHGLGNWDELFVEYEEGKTMESKLAKDFDKLELFMQLNIYKIEKCEEIEDYEDWRQDIRGKLSTEIARKIYDDIDELFISEDTCNVFMYILEPYKYDAFINRIEQNSQFLYIFKNYSKNFSTFKDKVRKVVLCKYENDCIHIRYIFECLYKGLGSRGDYKFIYKDYNSVNKTILKNKKELVDKLLSLKEFYSLFDEIH